MGSENILNNGIPKWRIAYTFSLKWAAVKVGIDFDLKTLWAACKWRGKQKFGWILVYLTCLWMCTSRSENVCVLGVQELSSSPRQFTAIWLADLLPFSYVNELNYSIGGNSRLSHWHTSWSSCPWTLYQLCFHLDDLTVTHSNFSSHIVPNSQSEYHKCCCGSVHFLVIGFSF